jgi:hypothetical protein
MRVGTQAWPEQSKRNYLPIRGMANNGRVEPPVEMHRMALETREYSVPTKPFIARRLTECPSGVGQCGYRIRSWETQPACGL